MLTIHQYYHCFPIYQDVHMQVCVKLEWHAFNISLRLHLKYKPICRPLQGNAGLYSQIIVALLITWDRAGSEAAAEGKEVGLESTGITRGHCIRRPHTGHSLEPGCLGMLEWLVAAMPQKLNHIAILLFFARLHVFS